MALHQDANPSFISLWSHFDVVRYVRVGSPHWQDKVALIPWNCRSWLLYDNQSLWLAIEIFLFIKIGDNIFAWKRHTRFFIWLQREHTRHTYK